MLKAYRVVYENTAVMFIHYELIEKLKLIHFDNQPICVQAKLV